MFVYRAPNGANMGVVRFSPVRFYPYQGTVYITWDSVVLGDIYAPHPCGFALRSTTSISSAIFGDINVEPEISYSYQEIQEIWIEFTSSKELFLSM